jgi:hypothetical protein
MSPEARTTIAFGINDSGQTVGAFSDATGGHGFVDTGGSFTAIDVPGAVGTLARGSTTAAKLSELSTTLFSRHMAS